jgi:hypothetical protein
VVGKVDCLSGVERWVPVTKGASIHAGDIIRTHENGRVTLRMTASQSFVRLTPSTMLRLVAPKETWDKSVLSGAPEETAGFSVRAVRGKAEFKAESDRWQPLEVNVTIPEGTVVRTADGAQIDLLNRSNRQFLRIAPGSILKLGDIAQASRLYRQPAIASATTAVGR